MSNLLLHPKTAESLANWTHKPSQFLVIIGPEGAGKLAIAFHLARQLLMVNDLDTYPHFLKLGLMSNKSEISIDQVRDVIHKLKLTTTGKAAIRRILLIEDGQYLSEEAQNSLLKTLEEPPADTQIIMTLDAKSSILPTILSRGQAVEVAPINLGAAKKYFGSTYAESTIEKAWLLSDGLTGLMHALLADANEHELKKAVDDAKVFLKATKYERLIRANEFTKSRRQIELLLNGLQRIVKTLQNQAILKNKKIDQSKMIQTRKQLEQLKTAVRANVSPKIIYLKLCLSLGL